MLLRNIVGLLLFLSVIRPAHAVPALLPLLPIIGILIAKGALLLGSLFFFVLSLFKDNRKKFLIWGVVLFLFFILLMLFIRHE